MPWSDRQHRLFEFVAHNPRAAHREGLGISQSDAQRMAGEGIKRAGGGIVRAMNRPFFMSDGGTPPINMTPLYQTQAMNYPAPMQESLAQIEASGGINPYSSLVSSSGATAYLRGGRVRRFAGGGGMPQVTRTGGPQFGGIGGTGSFSDNPLEQANSPGGEGDVRTRLVDTINRRHQQESTRLDADQATMTLMRGAGTTGMGAQPYLRRYAPPGMTSAMNDLFPSASTAFGQAQESWKRQLGQYVPNPMPYADGGAVQYDPRTYSPPRYDSGHDMSDETLDFIREHAPSLLAGVGATAAPFILPRPVNALARPIMRRMAKPVLGIEAASSKPLSEAQSLARYNLARQGTPHPYRDLPMETGQGAWSPGEGEPMQFNPLHMQELPRVSGPLKDNWMGLDYAAQMGENLEQAATPVSRFVPNLINTPKGANAFELSGVDREGLKQIAEMGGQNWVTAHRPGNRAMVFPLGDESVESMAKRMAGTLGTRARYGRSDPGIDRMLLSREPLGYEDALYRDFKISPRPKGFREYEDSVLNSLPLGAR